jgi:hypothetical protein
MKRTENIRADILNRKLRYKKKQKPEDLFIFRKNKNDLILNKRQLAFTTRVDRDPFINQIKAAYKNNIVAEQTP